MAAEILLLQSKSKIPSFTNNSELSNPQNTTETNFSMNHALVNENYDIKCQLLHKRSKF